MCASQVEDSSKLEYQAGQEEEEGDGKDKRKPEAQKKQQEQEAGAEADKDRQGGEGEEEEGGVNEDVDDKYEESHFAPPTAPEQVRSGGGSNYCTDAAGKEEGGAPSSIYMSGTALWQLILYKYQDLSGS